MREKYDALGRKHPRPMGWELLLEAIPGLARRFARMPAEDFDPGGSGVLVVRCPCGLHPMLEGSWDVEVCRCGAYYLSCGGVAFSSHPSPLKVVDETADSPAGVSAGRA